MSFEDELRETMRAHDHEAPTTADRPPLRVPARRRLMLPLVAAAAVLLVAGGAFAISESGSNSHHETAGLTTPPPGSTTPPTATCPAKYHDDHTKPWVPAGPSGIDADTRLAPDEVPTGAFICAYLGRGAGLSGTREITSGLATLRDSLTWLPRENTTLGRGPCTSDLQQHDRDRYLIHLSYPSGAMWVSAPGDHCLGSSNGDFSSTANLRDSVISAYESGSWSDSSTPPSNLPCLVASAGRLGSDTTFVPGDPASLLVCSGSPKRQRSVSSAVEIGPVVRALNQLPATPSSHECAPHPNAIYQLVFGYDRGPTVTVSLTPGCRPEVDNQSLQSESAASIVPLVQRLLDG